VQVVWSRESRSAHNCFLKINLHIIVSVSHYDIPDNNHLRHQSHLFFNEKVDNWVRGKVVPAFNLIDVKNLEPHL